MCKRDERFAYPMQIRNVRIVISVRLSFSNVGYTHLSSVVVSTHFFCVHNVPILSKI